MWYWLYFVQTLTFKIIQVWNKIINTHKILKLLNTPLPPKNRRIPETLPCKTTHTDSAVRDKKTKPLEKWQKKETLNFPKGGFASQDSVLMWQWSLTHVQQNAAENPVYTTALCQWHGLNQVKKINIKLINVWLSESCEFPFHQLQIHIRKEAKLAILYNAQP